MSTPVIIAAFNESESIGATLRALNRDCEPIVAANGCDDNTAHIAREFGATVIELKEQGKLLAIQETLRRLGDRALDPLLYLDADSRPLLPSKWARTMMSGVNPDAPYVRAGSISYFGGSSIDNLGWTLKAYMDSYKATRQETPRFCGANMLTQFHNKQILGKVLELPHIWLGEDHAIGMIVKENGGIADQTVDIRANVRTSARFLPPVAHVLSVGSEEAKKELGQQYQDRAAPGSISYGKYLRQRRKQKRKKHLQDAM